MLNSNLGFALVLLLLLNLLNLDVACLGVVSQFFKFLTIKLEILLRFLWHYKNILRRTFRKSVVVLKLGNFLLIPPEILIRKVITT